MAAASLLTQGGLSNPTPTLYSPSHKPRDEAQQQDPIVTEIFDLIRDIKDPEHPHTLEELNVVSEDCITVHHHHHHTIHATRDSTCSSSPSSKLPNDYSSRVTNSSTQGTSNDGPSVQPCDHTSSINSTTDPPNNAATVSDPPLSDIEEEEEDKELWIKIVFTPTVPHCSLATLIGLCLRVKLERQLEYRFKLDIVVSEGTHTIEGDVNKQINDKERVAAAMENPNLREMVEECIKEAEY